MTATPSSPDPGPSPPVAPKIPKIDVVHGEQRTDPYFWLRSKDSTDVLDYLNAENAYTEAVMKPTLALQQSLYQEMLGRIKETDLSVPVKRGEWLYYDRTEQGQQYSIYCRKKGNLQAPEVIILDLNELGKNQKFVSLGPFEVSDDGHLLAYGLDTTGFRRYTLQIKDLRTGAVLGERIARVTSIAFAKDNRTLFYAVEDEVSKRSYRLYRHVIGEDPAKDALIYEEKDERFRLTLERSRTKDYIFVTSLSHTTSEVRVIKANQPLSAPKVIAPREQDHEYYVDHGGDLFYILTNSGAPNFRLMTAKVNDPRRETWKEIVPHRPNVMLRGADVFATFYALLELEDGVARVRMIDLKTGESHAIDTPESIFVAFPEMNPEFQSTTYRYSYQSLITPKSIFDYDVRTHQSKLLKKTEVLGNYNPANYETSRLHAIAKDGVKIPISLVYKKGTKPDGTRPFLLYGYGSYGFPNLAFFKSERFSLLDRGIVFGLAHIRGGGDLGKVWHDQGRMNLKMNTFTDFIAAAEHVIKAGWAAKNQLAIEGRSAGGLLMGAVANMRPDLFKVVMTHVPFVDVINTMLDENLPLTVGEFEEWGNPKIKEQYDAMIKYSPYDNIAAQAYPTMLVTTSYNDSQVMYWEPAKYVAKLRATKTDHHPLLFKINMEPAGHGGQSGRYNRLHEVAFEYAFLLTQL